MSKITKIFTKPKNVILFWGIIFIISFVVMNLFYKTFVGALIYALIITAIICAVINFAVVIYECWYLPSKKTKTEIEENK